MPRVGPRPGSGEGPFEPQPRVPWMNHCASPGNPVVVLRHGLGARRRPRPWTNPSRGLSCLASRAGRATRTTWARPGARQTWVARHVEARSSDPTGLLARDVPRPRTTVEREARPARAMGRAKPPLPPDIDNHGKKLVSVAHQSAPPEDGNDRAEPAPRAGPVSPRARIQRGGPDFREGPVPVAVAPRCGRHAAELLAKPRLRR